MHPKHHPLSGTCLGVLISGLFSVVIHAAEPREWMSRKGGSLLAELVSVRGDQVLLNTPENRQVTLKIQDLSLADRQHLVEFGGADASIIADNAPGLPEKDVRIDASTFKRLPDKLSLGDETAWTFELMETPHFLIATAGGIRARNFAETAERLWHGMAFQHMNFRKDWGDKRMLIFVVEDRGAFKALGAWAAETLTALGQPDGARRMQAVWDQIGSTSIYMPESMIRKYNLLQRAKVFNVKDASIYRRPMSPFAIHAIAGTLLAQQMGNISSISAEGYFSITTGHSYLKEIQLGGKSETQLLDISGTNDEITSASGFKDGTSWAKTLRTLVRKGTVNPKLEDMLMFSGGDLDPERLVSIYALSSYMQSDSKRLSAFARMIRRIETSNQIPEAIEIARIFGFETVEEFNADWKKFIIEGSFR